MKTADLFKINRSSRRLNESIHKAFGKKINFESFNLEQLQDARNKIRTQLSQTRADARFNENLENDAYHQAQWMLDAINSAIAEREEYIVDAGPAEVEEGHSSEAELTLAKIAAAGDDGYDMIQDGMDGLLGGEVEIILQDMYNEVSRESRLHPDDDSEEIIDRMMDHIENDYGDYDKDPDEGGETDDNYALASAGFGSDEDYESYQEGTKQENNMNKLKESEINQASTIVTAKTMVDRVGRWIEELSGMENDTLLQLGDSIRDEIGQAEAKQFISTVAPAIQQALDNLKSTRETLSTAVNGLAGGEAPDMLGAEEPAGDDMDMAEPDAMNTGDDTGLDDLAGDEFAAADAAAGGAEAAGREKRESVDFQNRIYKLLAG
jgi:hypothetical protein